SAAGHGSYVRDQENEASKRLASAWWIPVRVRFALLGAVALLVTGLTALVLSSRNGAPFAVKASEGKVRAIFASFPAAIAAAASGDTIEVRTDGPLRL